MFVIDGVAADLRLQAGALDTDDMILMAAAFAGRGAGTCAILPPNESFDFLGVVESGTIAARLATSPVRVIDDGASCDHHGYLDPGESGTLRITLANRGVIGAASTVVTATTTTPGITLGEPVVVGTVPALSQIDVAIPIKAAGTAPASADLAINVKVDSDAGCDTDHIAIPFHVRMGVDEAAGVATGDSFETQLFTWTPTGTIGASVWSRATALDGSHALFGPAGPAPVPVDVRLLLLHRVGLDDRRHRGPRDQQHAVPGPCCRADPVRRLTPAGVAPDDGIICGPTDPRHSLTGIPGASDPQ